MSADVNFVCMSGRLLKDIEVKPVTGTNIISGVLMVFRREKEEDKCSFIDFKTFAKSDKQVEFYKSAFVKNAKVLLNGSLVQEQWEKDGQKHSKIVLMASRIEPMGAAKGGASSEAGFPDSDFPE